ncbi:MAG: hypothetical protein WCW84_06710 [Sulfurimonas sp.]|jgi:hypothetical protein
MMFDAHAMIEGMCLTHRHDFELLPASQQENIRTHIKQLYEHNIKPVIDSLQASSPVIDKTVELQSSAKEYIALVEELAETDAKLINMAFGISGSLGLNALKNSTDSFETYLRSNDTMFIRGMSIEWRTYLVKLLLNIDEQYRDVATPAIILG